jgi:signal transduction histidine kinase
MVDRASEEALVLVLDLTERKRAELALRNSEKLATIGRLAGTIAHEINNPLDAVNNLLFLIQSDPQLSPNSRNFVRLATDEMARIIQICRQMLGFYRESNTPVEVEIDSVLSNVVSLYQRKIRLFNTHVESQLRFEGVIRGFPGEMRQLFSNLFVNALEAAGQNGRVRLRSRLARDWRSPGREGVRVIVHDNGHGIEPGLFANIFEPFFTTKGEKGTGLGLWVSRGIVEKHGGYLRVRTNTRAGQSGTCFSVFLPIDPSVAASAPDELRLPA